MLLAVLIKHDSNDDKQLNYLQGAHDVASVFLLTLDLNLGVYCFEAFVDQYLSDFLQLPMDLGYIPLAKLVYYLLYTQEPELTDMLCFG